MADDSDLLSGYNPQSVPQANPPAADTPEYKSDLLSGFDPATGGALPAQVPDTSHGIAETAGLHGLQGITAGFGDELAGLGAVSGANRPSLSPIDLIHGLTKMGYEKLTGGHEYADQYAKARDERRKALEESAAEHPYVAVGADVAGSLALPGGSVLKAPAMGVRFLRGVGIGAAQGALRGAGEASELADVPADVAKGAGIGAVLGGPLNAVIGPRGVSAAKQSLMDTANKYSVALPNYVVSENPLFQFYGKTLSQLPIVGNSLMRAAEEAKQGVQNIRSDIIEGAFGRPVSPSEARTIASKAAEDAQKGFISDSKAVSKKNYEDITNALNNPNFKLKPQNLENEVQAQIGRIGAYGASPKGLLQKAADAAAMPGGLTYPALKDLRTDLYRSYRTMEGRGGIDYADYSKILTAVTGDMENTIIHAGGPKAIGLWKSANLQHAAGKDMAEEIGQAIGKGTADTAAADAIFRNINSARPNINSINILRNTMKPDEWAKIQAATLSRMGADEAGNFSIQKAISADAKLSKIGKDAMFGPPGSYPREGYDAILKIGNSIQRLERFTNHSNTAVMGVGIGALIELWRKPISGAMEIASGGLLGAILARRVTAKNASAFSQGLEKYVSNPFMMAAGKVPRSLEIAGRNLAISIATQNEGQQ